MVGNSVSNLCLKRIKHICPIPMILVGKMWEELITWVKKYPLKEGLISKKDLDQIYFAKNNKDAMKIIQNTYNIFKKEGEKFCQNIKKYRLD